ncbi:MAG: hypothetical protein AAGE61_01250 [Pseudomonadota bacterium]
MLKIVQSVTSCTVGLSLLILFMFALVYSVTGPKQGQGFSSIPTAEYVRGIGR